MATRPKGYGMTSELHRKIADKYNVELEKEARLWIQAVIGERIGNDETEQMEPGMDRFHKELKDGIVLCKLINQINPGSVKKVNTSHLAFKQMENIGNFVTACVTMGIAPSDLFQTADLYERTNIGQVVNGIFALGRRAQKLNFQGPILGVKEADFNPRHFSDETLKAGQRVIGLQMGSNKGASQQGMSFGNTRSII